MSTRKQLGERLVLEDLILTNATSFLEGANFTQAGARVFVPDRCVADLSLMVDENAELIASGGGVTAKYSIRHYGQVFTGRTAAKVPGHYVVEERPAPEAWRVSGPGWFHITAHGNWSTGGNLISVFAQAMISLAVGGLCPGEKEDLLSQAKMESL